MNEARTSLDKQTERQLQVQAEIIDIVRKMKDLAHKHLDDHRGRQAHPPQGHRRHGRHAGPGAAEVYPEIMILISAEVAMPPFVCVITSRFRGPTWNHTCPSGSSSKIPPTVKHASMASASSVAILATTRAAEPRTLQPGRGPVSKRPKDFGHRSGWWS